MVSWRNVCLVDFKSVYYFCCHRLCNCYLSSGPRILNVDILSWITKVRVKLKDEEVTFTVKSVVIERNIPWSNRERCIYELPSAKWRLFGIIVIERNLIENGEWPITTIQFDLGGRGRYIVNIWHITYILQVLGSLSFSGRIFDRKKRKDIKLGCCLFGKRFEIWLRTKKPKMGNYWQWHLNECQGGLVKVVHKLNQ